jgi:hypothetical protein
MVPASAETIPVKESCQPTRNLAPSADYAEFETLDLGPHRHEVSLACTGSGHLSVYRCSACAAMSVGVRLALQVACMPHNISLKELMSAGVVVQPHEAVAIVQQLIHTAGTTLGTDPPLGPASPENVMLARDGSVRCHGCTIAPAVSEIGLLLDSMLVVERPAPVPGALRYTIARALAVVDAPPFGSLAALSASLLRFENGERHHVVRELLGRLPPNAPTDVVTGPAPMVERRRSGASATELRRQLRIADQLVFEALHRTRAQLPSVAHWHVQTPSPSRPGVVPTEAMTGGVAPHERPNGAAGNADMVGETYAIASAWRIGWRTLVMSTAAVIVCFVLGYAATALHRSVVRPRVASPSAISPATAERGAPPDSGGSAASDVRAAPTNSSASASDDKANATTSPNSGTGGKSSGTPETHAPAQVPAGNRRSDDVPPSRWTDPDSG